MPDKKPKNLTFVAGVFVLLFLDRISNLYQYSQVTDYLFLEQLKLSWVFFAFNIAFVVLGIGAVYLYRRHHVFGYGLAIGLCLLLVGENVLFGLLGFLNSEEFKESYILSRELRGMSQIEESDWKNQAWLLSPAFFVGVTVAFTVFYLYLIKIITRSKLYFYYPRGPWYGPNDPTPKEACPCCDYVTLPERGSYLICAVCFWEDDGTNLENQEKVSGPNHISLIFARSNFTKYGACDPKFANDVISEKERRQYKLMKKP